MRPERISHTFLVLLESIRHNQTNFPCPPFSSWQIPPPQSTHDQNSSSLITADYPVFPKGFHILSSDSYHPQFLKKNLLLHFSRPPNFRQILINTHLCPHFPLKESLPCNYTHCKTCHTHIPTTQSFTSPGTNLFYHINFLLTINPPTWYTNSMY